MVNPLVIQGTLNRLRGSVAVALFPQLNVNAAYLGKEAISFSLEGESAQLIGTLTGAVTSPEPYMFATISIHLLRTQNLAELYKVQLETETLLGPIIVYPDVATGGISSFKLINCVLQSVQELSFNGQQADMVVRIRGIYPTNALMYAAS